MKRLLITGATGLIGRHVGSAALERGYEVHAVSRRPQKGQRGMMHWHTADLLDTHAAQKLVRAVVPTHLIHTAWCTEPGSYWTSPENERWRAASVALVRAFGAVGGQRVVVAGTCAEYDWAHAGGPLSEAETPLAPRSPYTAAKDALRGEIEAIDQHGGPSAAWGRVFFVFGPGEHPNRLVASVARRLLRGEPAPASDGLQVRDFMIGSEVAAAFLALLDSPVCGAVNIASGAPVSTRALLEEVASATGRPDLLRLGVLPRRDNEPPRLVAAIDRLRAEVGWSPGLDLTEGVRHTVAWWRERDAAASLLR